ncbi:MAG: 3'-phosphoesterase [Candidatus Desulfofervidaceae bacterium]|nr:3'-phosphoesterase [Candidatus Desulfofervidaceae bacterium]MDL1971516.1 3'-phosphoesterase [Candidatus Desulfofervidaceae bacterium]
MSLEKYKQKRLFTETPEPPGEVVEQTPSIFVVQEHHASHLHWDFRLAMDGVLKSWAIPKEPPTEKGIKRLAVQTEDHPLEYADFEGEIPPGHYGAGKVIIWDKGTYELLKKEPEKLVFKLEGNRLKGTYVLLRFPKAGPKNWLFFRKG